MSDKVVNLTKDGYTLNTIATDYFDIPFTGTLSETNATYMFEINLVVHQINVSVSKGGRWGLFSSRSGGITTSGSTVADWSDGTGLTLVSSVVSNAVRLTITFPYTGGVKYWRAYITCYVKDNIT